MCGPPVFGGRGGPSPFSSLGPFWDALKKEADQLRRPFYMISRNRIAEISTATQMSDRLSQNLSEGMARR
jgi:hypothetical protein